VSSEGAAACVISDAGCSCEKTFVFHTFLAVEREKPGEKFSRGERASQRVLELQERKG